MANDYRIIVFGKKKCDKCQRLKQRLGKLLSREDMAGFERVELDVETEDGLVEFCRAECINPQRIPAFVVAARDEDSGEYHYIPNPNPRQEDDVCGSSRLSTYLGLQTDYTEKGNGVISPKMIKQILHEAQVA